MKNEFKQTILLYWALLAGQIIFALVVVFMTKSNTDAALSWPSGSFPGVIGPVVVLAGLMGARTVNQLNMKNAPENAPLPEKVSHFRKSVIMRSALIEGCNLFMVVLTLLDANLFWILCFAAGILGFWFFKPTLEEFSENYKLTYQDLQEIQR